MIKNELWKLKHKLEPRRLEALRGRWCDTHFHGGPTDSDVTDQRVSEHTLRNIKKMCPLGDCLCTKKDRCTTLRFVEEVVFRSGLRRTETVRTLLTLLVPRTLRRCLWDCRLMSFDSPNFNVAECVEHVTSNAYASAFKLSQPQVAT